MNGSIDISGDEQLTFSAVLMRQLAGPDMNLASLEAVTGWPELTLRSYRDKERSPQFDDLVHRRKRIPRPMFLDLLQTLAGPLAVIVPAEALLGDPDLTESPASVVATLMRCQNEMGDVCRQLINDDATRRITCANATLFGAKVREITMRLAAAVIVAERCAANGIRRRAAG